MDALTAPHTLEYPYKRSLGPVMSAFFTALRERRLVGVRTPSGRVVCPPTEYDPETSEPCSEMVEVGPSGVVESWAWVPQPRPKHPLPHPFAWVLVKLDGADTALLHALDGAEEEALQVGMRVRARWTDEPQGAITDFCFEPERP